MILSYTNAFSTYFSAVFESILFFYFCSAFEDKSTSRWMRILVQVCTAGLIALVHAQKYSFTTQCPLLLAITGGYLLIGKKSTFKDVIFVSVAVCILQEISHTFAEDVIRNWILGRGFGYGYGSRENYFDIVLYLIVLAVLTQIFRRYAYREGRKEIRYEELLVPFLSTVPFFYLRYVYYNLFGPEESSYEIYVLLLIIGTLSLIQIILSEYLIYEHINKEERSKMELLLKAQQQKYELQNATAQAVNRNYHDLKHILAAGTDNGNEQLQIYLNRMKEEISPYEGMIRTGNETVDVLMSSKIIRAQKHHVSIVPYIDGRCLSFIDSVDLSVIVGNAVDNAIEAAERVQEEEKKEIYIKIAENHGTVIMRFENWFEQINDDLSTMKKDQENHGYGIQSIRMLTEKYKGTMTVEAENNQFILTLMIPVSRGK